MILIVSLVVILLVSFIMAVRSVGQELSIPKEVRSIKIRPRKKISGVIVFLKKKIIHYPNFHSY